MSKHKRGPFPEFQGFRPLPEQANLDKVLLDRMETMRQVLYDNQCYPVGTESGLLRDADWGADLSELVIRSQPHNIQDVGGSVKEVYIHLDTLVAEVDDLYEVCAWMYEEY